jgi:hypothetical protein
MNLQPLALTQVNKSALAYNCARAGVVSGLKLCDSRSDALEDDGPTLLKVLNETCTLHGCYERKLTDLIYVHFIGDLEPGYIITFLARGIMVTTVSPNLHIIHGPLTKYVDLITTSIDATLATYLHQLLCRAGYTDIFYNYKPTDTFPYILRHK